uniref:Acyl-CoA thioesterase 11 n=1 Tax=Strix occidentalis caurina TaxID=311401 RepID=A0A8D0FHV9_STROC
GRQTAGNHKPRSCPLQTRQAAVSRERDTSQGFTGVISPEAVGQRSACAPCMLSVLLQVADAVCFSFPAERHAGCPCVTASMDDIYFEHTISVGQVVNIKAKVNRAFNSSMEVGIQVSYEDLCSGKHCSICKAYATFVAQGPSGSKVKLKPLAPQTEEEKIEHSIAAERRRMRLVHKDTLKDLLTRSPRETGTVDGPQHTTPPYRESRGHMVLEDPREGFTLTTVCLLSLLMAGFGG